MEYTWQKLLKGQPCTVSLMDMEAYVCVSDKVDHLLKRAEVIVPHAFYFLQQCISAKDQWTLGEVRTHRNR